MTDIISFPKPLFIVVEGLDGAGTTTQSRLLCDMFQRREQPALLTNEPSNGPIGVMIRQMLSMRIVTPVDNGQFEPINRETLALLFAADRLDHVAAEIAPALARGEMVISDRYYHSSLAYQGDQGNGDATDYDWVHQLNARARVPDITFFLEAPVDLCLARLANRTGRRDIYETRQTLSRLEKRYDEVMTLLSNEGQPIQRLDASLAPQEIHQSICKTVAGMGAKD